MVATNASGGNAFRTATPATTSRAGSGVGFGAKRTVSRAGDGDGDRRSGKNADSSSGPRPNCSSANATSIARDRGPRFDRCGYQLHDVLTDTGLDLAKLLVGSEGTLAVVTEATLRTVPLPGGTCVALLGFPTLDAAVRAGLDLRDTGRSRATCSTAGLLSVTRRKGDGVGPIPPAVGAALLVTFEADTEREASRAGLGRRRSRCGRDTSDARARRADRAPRRAWPACAACARRPSPAVHLARGPRPLAFIEDVGVPADALPEFLAGVQDILKRYEITASFLVHALTGQVHTRPAGRPRRPRRPREALAARRGGPRAGPVARRHGQHAARHRPRADAVGRAAVRPARSRCSAS